MATSNHRERLRVLLQDYTDRDGNILGGGQQAFQSSELDILIDSAFLEATDGRRDSSNASGDDEALALMLARIDGILMIAQDESRRIKWVINNKVIDESTVAPTLINIAAELRRRYESHKKLKVEEKVEGVTNTNSGGVLHFNDTTAAHFERNFNNADVRRNRPRH